VSALLAATLGVGLAGLWRFAPWTEAWTDEKGSAWHAIAWPFLRDGFAPGRAWRKDDVTIYVRPKLGFCANCETGVVEDSEVDQVTDLDLLDEKFKPVQDGKVVRVAGLSGRARLYNIATADGTRTVEAIAVNSRCDLVVALLVGKVDDPAVLKDAHAFLESSTVQVWLNRQLEDR
jgi:hypothetical protein